MNHHKSVKNCKIFKVENIRGINAKKFPQQKAEEERRYISARGVINTVFHDMYIVNQCLDKPIEY